MADKRINYFGEIYGGINDQIMPRGKESQMHFPVILTL